LYVEYLERNDYTDSEHELEEMVRLKPSARKYHFLLHVVEERLGNSARARDEFFKSIPKQMKNSLAGNQVEVRPAGAEAAQPGDAAAPAPIPPASSAPAPAQ
jgi:hypothetical protein